jgi:hypothetical protein
LKSGHEEEQIHRQQDADSSRENERKERDKLSWPERPYVSGYTNRQPIKFESRKPIEKIVQPFPPAGIKMLMVTNSSPIRLPSSELIERPPQEDRRKKSINADNTTLNPVRSTSEARILTHSHPSDYITGFSLTITKTYNKHRLDNNLNQKLFCNIN